MLLKKIEGRLTHRHLGEESMSGGPKERRLRILSHVKAAVYTGKSKQPYMGPGKMCVQ